MFDELFKESNKTKSESLTEKNSNKIKFKNE